MGSRLPPLRILPNVVCLAGFVFIDDHAALRGASLAGDPQQHGHGCMSSRKTPDLGRALGARQASILEYLWAHGPQSVSDLHRGLSEREDLAYTTVFTELSRMLKKGLVVKGNAGGSHLDIRYRAALTREGVVSSFVAQTVGALISAHGSAAIHGFVDAVATDPSALEELRRQLNVRSRKP